MYKLKSVYATISFERNKINLLVVEHAKNDKINCLYYNSVEHNYLDENISFINYDHLVDKLRTLVRGADNFLGINIKRYIVNISCLPIKSIQGRSPESLVFDTLTEEHLHNYVNKLTLAKRDENQYALHVYATGWYLDGQYTPQFPEGSNGKKISFDYVGIISQRRIIDQFVDLLKQVGGKTLAVTCNSLCLGVPVNGGGIDGVVVDIKTTSTIINLYNKYGEIKAVTTIPKGSNWYLNETKKLLGINPEVNLAPMIEALDTIADVNEETVLLHKHSCEFLTIQEADVHSLSTALKITSKRLFKEVEQMLGDMRTKCHSNFNKVYLNIVESLVYAFKEACPRNTIDDLPIEVLTNTVVGLEDYAANNMLAAISYIHNLQSQSDEYHTYSIDPFVSQKAANYQFKQHLWTRLGIISTRWAAKLGE